MKKSGTQSDDCVGVREEVCGIDAFQSGSQQTKTFDAPRKVNRHHTRTRGVTEHIQTRGGSSNSDSKRNEETSGYIIEIERKDMGGTGGNRAGTTLSREECQTSGRAAPKRTWTTNAGFALSRHTLDNRRESREGKETGLEALEQPRRNLNHHGWATGREARGRGARMPGEPQDQDCP